MTSAEKIKSLEEEIIVLKAKLEESELLSSSRKMWLQNVFDSMPNAMFIKNDKHQFVISNKAFSYLLGVDQQDIVGRTDDKFFDDKQAKEIRDMDTEVLSTGKVKWNEGTLVLNGEVNMLLTSKSRIADRNGKYYILGIVTDITNNSNQRLLLEKKNAEIEEQKNNIEILLKEVHHRVKNNLQVVCSLLNLQMNDIENEKMQEVFQNSKNRIMSMSKVHEALYLSNNFSSLNFKHYVNSLVSHLESVYLNKEGHTLKMDLDDVFLDTETAMPIGLAINEIVSNSFKHARVAAQELIIYIKIKRSAEGVTFDLGDNGPGINPSFQNTGASESLGLELINIFADQLSIEMNRSCKNGLHYSFALPLKSIELEPI